MELCHFNAKGHLLKFDHLYLTRAHLMKFKTTIFMLFSPLSSAEAYMKFLVRERERARSDGKS
jgi:hypothetical protein